MKLTESAYTPEEVANLLKISKYTVYELIKRGDLNAFKVGNKMRIEQKDLDDFKENQQTHSKKSIQVKESAAINPVKSIRITGSHDLLLEHLFTYLSKEKADISIQPSFVGSLEGLMLLYRGNADIASIHLLNPDTNEYNISFIKQLFMQESVSLVRFAAREQGFIVKKGNPKKVKTFADLTKPSITFVNRQKGSGTRLLFDHHLLQNAIDPTNIKGYEQEEWNHLATASHVSSGRADVAFGIQSAAENLQLDFIPIAKEQFDLVFIKNKQNEQAIEDFYQILNSADFKRSLQSIKGYDISEMGKVIFKTQNWGKEHETLE